MYLTTRNASVTHQVHCVWTSMQTHPLAQPYTCHRAREQIHTHIQTANYRNRPTHPIAKQNKTTKQTLKYTTK